MKGGFEFNLRLVTSSPTVKRKIKLDAAKMEV